MYQNKRNNALFTVFAIALLITILACAPSHFTPVEKTTYTTVKTLDVAKQFRHTGLQVAGDFYKKGLMEEDVKLEIIKIGNELQRTINVAAEALQVYLASDGGNAKDLEMKILMYQQLYGKFSDLVMPYIIKNLED